MKKKPTNKPPRPLKPEELRTVIGGYGVGNTGGVHPNPPIGPGG